MQLIQAIEILLPVALMLFLGVLARRAGWITVDQNNGAKKIVFTVLFPILIFHVIFTSQLNSRMLHQIVYLIPAWLVVFVIGRLLVPFTGRKYGHISPYFLMTCEGGSVALPLYLSLFGAAYSINIVTFDVAGVLVNFIAVPLLVSNQLATKMTFRDLMSKIVRSSFIIAIAIGLVLNLLGCYDALTRAGLQSTYNNAADMAIAPIAAIILFTLGYELKIDTSNIRPLLRLGLVRMALCTAVIGGFFLIFPELMADKAFRVAVLLYFMCPTGFPVPLQVHALSKGEDDESFMSAFISLYMIIALTAYTLITLFVM